MNLARPTGRCASTATAGVTWGQIGSEATWQEYLANLLAARRNGTAFSSPGSIFVNLGDKYANDAKWGGATSGKHVTGLHGKTGTDRTKVRTGIPPKS